MNKILEQISSIGIVPVIKIDDVEKAVPLAKALCDGGLPCAEVTFRTDAAEESIRRISKEVPQMLVGAGTVLTIDQVDRAVAAGAKFIVSPGLNPTIVKYCVDKGILVTPGCATPSDIEKALELGLNVVKFFPAEPNGGLNYIKAIAAPYTAVKFMPTGGISAKNLNEYLEYDKIVACGGSWMVDAKYIEAGDFDAIRKLTAEAVKTMLGFEIAHVGINCENDKEAQDVAKLFCMAFGFDYSNGNSSIFCGKDIEVMKTKFLGAKGHIAIRTNHMERAKAFLENKGYQFNMDTYKAGASVYFKDEFAGFAVHLLQKK